MRINFAHKYAKLKHKQYTTIRGKTKALALKIGQQVEVTVNRQPLHTARIREMTVTRICDISLDILRRDAAYENKTVTTKQDFVDLLNSFYPNITLESEVCIIWLEVV